MTTPEIRIRRCNDAPVRPEGAYVLYWMIAARRTRWNFGLQRAVEHGRALGLPLVVFEPMRAGHRWACARFHHFVLDGMADNAARIRRLGRACRYYPYMEPRPGAGHGLLEALAARAALVVTDDAPAFFQPRMVAAAAVRLKVGLEAVDSCGILPFRAPGRTFATAHAFRRHLHRELPAHLAAPPQPDPLSGLPRGAAPPLPESITRRWPPVEPDVLSRPSAARAAIGRLPIDQAVGASVRPGGSAQAASQLDGFVGEKLDRYAADRNHPDRDATSGLSPYLHFGYVSPHEVLLRVAGREGTVLPSATRKRAEGRRTGWWGMSEGAEAFLDQVVTWRELGYIRCAHVPDYDRYEALPEWARTTLGDHAGDPRDAIYDLDALESGRTGDALWNAAQNQLRREGRMHNYLRMLWGKRILEWTPSPADALATMIHLNNKLALDGRGPTAYTGIMWVLGLHDRAWGPERPIFGKVRYMSSANTMRKCRVRRYLAEYGDG